MKIPLWVRLLASYLLLIAVGLGVTYLTVRLLAPHLFEQDVHGRGSGNGTGTGAGPAVRAAFRTALNAALVVAVVISAAAGGLLAVVVSRRIVRPLSAIRQATRRIAAGHYTTRVPVGPVPELAAVAADVNTLATALADTETRRARLLGDVAHEMRTPLTALDGYVEGLIDGVFTADERTLAALADELHRLHRLADDLAAVSRAEENRLDLQAVDLDLADVVRAASDRLAAQFADGEVRLDVDAPGGVAVHGDRQRIEQVLTNLLGNSLAATAPGGTVSVTVRGTDRAAVVTVADTGVGLDADELERVFERFYRARNRPARTRGTGIGLTIARSIARAHGGDLTASSPGPGKGATFTLTLPRGGR